MFAARALAQMSTPPSKHPSSPRPGSQLPSSRSSGRPRWPRAMIVVLIVLVGLELYVGSRLSLSKFGAGFLWSSEWDPVAEKYGALPFIFGTLVSSLLALVIAVPAGRRHGAVPHRTGPAQSPPADHHRDRDARGGPERHLRALGHLRPHPLAEGPPVRLAQALPRVPAPCSRARSTASACSRRESSSRS